MEPENVTPGNKTPKSPWGRYVYIIKRMKIIYVKYVLNCFQNSEHLIDTYQCGSWDMDWGSQFRSKFPLCLPNNSRAEIFSNWMAELNNLNLHPHYFTKLESYEDSTIPTGVYMNNYGVGPAWIGGTVWFQNPSHKFG
jgi:hypothetical protein